MPNKLKLPYAEFYITNSCNFNCTGCNRFNNYNFSGTQLWEDYKDQYQQWSKILDIETWTILGGEPLMNPSYLDWIKGVRELWPNATGWLTTNGHFLKKDNSELYEILKETKGQVALKIGLHNVNRFDQVFDTVKSWLKGSIDIKRSPKNLRDLPNFDENWQQCYTNIRDPSWPDCNTVEDWDQLPTAIKKECSEIFNFSPEIFAETRKDWILVDHNGVTVHIQYEDHFHQGALIVQGNDTFGLHQSDPIKAHSICHMKTCHHFVHGKLYKCGVAALLPEFGQQFNLDLSESDQQLVNSYQPADPTQDWNVLENFINNIGQPIPQCKFCPENYQIKQFFAKHGNKIKISKKT